MNGPRQETQAQEVISLYSQDAVEGFTKAVYNCLSSNCIFGDEEVHFDFWDSSECVLKVPEEEA